MVSGDVRWPRTYSVHQVWIVHEDQLRQLPKANVYAVRFRWSAGHVTGWPDQRAQP